VPVSDLLREEGEESAADARRPDGSGALAGG
jgi:hypothetical protein